MYGWSLPIAETWSSKGKIIIGVGAKTLPEHLERLPQALQYGFSAVEVSSLIQLFQIFQLTLKVWKIKTFFSKENRIVNILNDLSNLPGLLLIIFADG
jgi:hypothetical protein